MSWCTDDEQAGPTANLTSLPATVAVNVVPVNDRPVASSQDISVLNSETTTVNLSADDEDPEVDQALTFIVTDHPLHGTLSGPNISVGQAVYTPTAGYVGPDSFSFIAVDDNLAGRPPSLMSAEATVGITVREVNDPPSFTAGPDQTVNEGAGLQTIANWTTNISPGPPNEAGQTLTFHLTTDNDSLFATVPSIDATTGTLTYAAADDAFGVANVTVRLQDDGGTADGGNDTSPPETFVITVNSVNDTPSFGAGLDETVNEDAGLQTINAWATNISAGANESTQALNFTVSTDNDALFSVLPSIDTANGNLAYTPAANANGEAVVTVVLRDNGGTQNGGSDASAPLTFCITINRINNRPVVHPQSITTTIDTALPITLTGEDRDPEVEQVLTFAILDVPLHGMLTGVVPNVTYVPNTGYTGPDSFTFLVTDDNQAGTPAMASTPASVNITVQAPAPAPEGEYSPPGDVDLHLLDEVFSEWPSGDPLALEVES